MRFFLRAGLLWLISAVTLLLAVSFFVSKSGIGSKSIGYLSSALSFVTAFFAGAGAVKGRSSGIIYTSLLTAAALVTILLTVGFLIKGSDMGSSGILSVVTFSFSGCLVGGVLMSGRKNRIKKTRLDVKKR